MSLPRGIEFEPDPIGYLEALAATDSGEGSGGFAVDRHYSYQADGSVGVRHAT